MLAMLSRLRPLQLRPRLVGTAGWTVPAGRRRCCAAAPPLARAGGAAQRAPPATADEEGAPHVSVLLLEVLEQLGGGRPLKVYVDCTLGAGGHAVHMMRQHPELSHLVGVDIDPLAHRLAGERLERERARRQAAVGDSSGAGGDSSGGSNSSGGSGSSGRPAVHLLRGNYSEVAALLGGLPGGSLVGKVDAMLMDLGVSSMQLDTAERGFSFASDGPLDMRLNPDAPVSAATVVNGWTEAALGRALLEYGEEKAWKLVARRIVEARERAPIVTTQQLVAVVGQTLFRDREKRAKGARSGKQIHPATRTFQALRIAVNDELGQLEAALPAALSCLAPGGRLGVISFHSLEDRLVKHAFLRAAGRPTPDQEALTYGADGMAALEAMRAAALGGIVTRRPIVAGDAEVAANPRSRSAKLRVFQRAGGDGDAAGHGARLGSKRRREQREQQQQRQRERDSPPPPPPDER